MTIRRIQFLAALVFILIPATLPAAQPFRASAVETRFVQVGEVRYAYRIVGVDKGGVPLVLLNRFRGTMDHWDPALIEALSSERRVILFDNVGMAHTNGTTPDTLAGFARGAADFVEALGLKAIDVLGFSMGGHVAQQLALDRPVLVANGNDDIMAPTYASYAIAQAVPNAKLIIYPDSGHGFLFQYAEEFGRDVAEFLK